MIKVYRKTATIKAERFDGSKDMAKRYGAELYSESGYGYDTVEGEPDGDGYVLITSEGELLVRTGDWIATGINGEHWAIADDVFKKTYAELPVIPKAVADWIEKCKHDGYGTSVGDMLCYERQPEKVRNWIERTPGTYDCNHRRYKEYQDLVARAWLDGYVVEEDE